MRESGRWGEEGRHSGGVCTPSLSVTLVKSPGTRAGRRLELVPARGRACLGAKDGRGRIFPGLLACLCVPVALLYLNWMDLGAGSLDLSVVFPM